MTDEHYPDEEFLALLERAMDGFSMHRLFGWYTMADQETGETVYEIYDLNDGTLAERGRKPTRPEARTRAMARAELLDDKEYSKKWNKNR